VPVVIQGFGHAMPSRLLIRYRRSEGSDCFRHPGEASFVLRSFGTLMSIYEKTWIRNAVWRL